jgi:hypothetical protein
MFEVFNLFNITINVIEFYKANQSIAKQQYEILVNNSKARGLIKSNLSYYTEIHHIISRCLGGTNDSENLVLLTYREHILAHMLLYAVYPDNHDLFLSFGLLVDLKDKYFSEGLDVDLQSLELIKQQKSEYMKEHNPMKNPEIAKKVSEKKLGVPTGRTTPPSEETRAKIANTLKELYSNPENHPFYGKHHTPESIEKIRQNRKGKGIGRNISDEQKQSLREFHSKPVIGPDGTEYESIKVAASHVGLTRPELSKIVNHHPEKGWKFNN